MQNNPFQTALVSLLLLGAPRLRAGSSQTASASQETLTYTDAAASVAYTWTAPVVASTNSLGKLHISAQQSGHADAELDLPISVQPSGATLRLTGLVQLKVSSLAGA